MKILVVDDHAILRQGLAALLRDSGAASEVVHAANVAQGLAMAAAHPDLDAVLLDLKLPGGDGINAIAALARTNPVLPIIILSASEDPADVRRALDMGALGYVPKSSSPETLLSALRLVMAGEIYVPPLMLEAERNGSGPRLDSLTPRQTQVLAALAGGLSNRELAARFDLSEKTVKVHVSAIFRALEVTNRTQAARVAQAAGIIPPPVPGPGAG
jgi:two-component system nitrate/nitrite response regulator NarL